MPHLVNDKCIMCKHTDCVEVCPVDCFYEGENMLVINPDECIDCGVCIPECPVDAIYQTDDKEDPWYKHNVYFANTWPNITVKKDAMKNAKEYSGRSDKTKLFSKNPGSDS